LSKKQKKRKTIVNLDDFQFDPSTLDLKWSKNLITTFDGYRIHRCFDLTFIEKAVGQGELSRSFVNQWKVIRTVLHKFAAIGPNVPGVQKKLFRKQITSLTSMILLTFALPLMVFTWVFRIEFLQPFAFPFAIFAAFLALTAWTVSNYYNRQIAWSIVHYLDENPQLLNKEQKHLKKWVEVLIPHTARLIRKESLEFEEEPVKFYNDDYDGIIVVKEPNFYRKHYTVMLGVSSGALT
jgi:hypothetical protein